MLAFALVLLAADPTSPEPPDPVAVSPEPASQSAQRMADKVTELRALFEQLECEKVVALAPAIEDHRLATDVERHEAMFRRGYCLVVIGNTGEADQLFRDIMRENATAAPTFPIEPRVLALVESARSEIVKEHAAAAAAERARKVARIDLDIDATHAVKGGHRVFFDVKLSDPDNAVRSMRVDFRKQGDLEYYALPVVRRSDGTWHGEVPGTYTRSEVGTRLEWYITLSDESGEPLKVAGTRERPNSMEVLPGSAIAEDLKANERLPQYGRVLFAIGAPFALTGGAYALAYLGSNLLLPEGAAPFGFAVGAFFVPAVANYFVSALLLDGVYALIPPLVELAFGAIVALSVIDYDAYLAIAAQSRPPVFNDFKDGAALGLFSATGAVVVTTAVTTTLVLLDPPSAE